MSTPRRQRVYEPRRLMGRTVEDLQRELQEELDSMSLALRELTDFDYLPQGALPERYSDGTVMYLMAQASPAGIAGLHQVRGGVWKPLAEVKGDTAWTEPTLLVGTHYGGSFARVAFRKLSSGLVVMKGLLRDPVLTSTLFTLPVGYRPTEKHIFVAQTPSGDGRVDVGADGVVNMLSGGIGWVSFSGVNFYVG